MQERVMCVCVCVCAFVCAGDEGVARPSTAAPSTLRPGHLAAERPVPAQVLHHARQFAGEHARTRSAQPWSLDV